MPEVIDIKRGVHLSIAAFAEAAGMDRDTISKKIRAAGIEPSGKRGAWPIYSLKDLLQIVMLSDEDGQFDPDKLDPFKRRAYYQAEAEKLALALKRGDVIPRIEAEAEQARNNKVVVESLETLPDILERDAGLTPKQAAIVEKCIDAVRESMYLKQIEDGDAERPVRDRA